MCVFSLGFNLFWHFGISLCVCVCVYGLTLRVFYIKVIEFIYELKKTARYHWIRICDLLKSHDFFYLTVITYGN